MTLLTMLNYYISLFYSECKKSLFAVYLNLGCVIHRSTPVKYAPPRLNDFQI